MTHDQFIGQVQNRGHLSTRADAERATRATLETLAERLAGGEAGHLASQLPREIGEHLRRADESEVERLDLDGFYQRVSEREGRELPEAVHHAKAVIGVVREAVSAGEFADVETQLPEEFRHLLEAEA
ncbi:MAG: DUF2267 domain-containing protein [Trueperaceae bacterium]